MVTHPSLPGVNVAVEIEGKKTKEWQDSTHKEENERTITRFIEAVSNATFSIKIEVDKSSKFNGDSYDCSICLDGQSVGGPLIKKTKIRDGGGCFERGTQVAGGQKRQFQFSSIETTNFHGYGLDAELLKVKDLGRIYLTLCHAKLGKPKIKTTKSHPRSLNAPGILSEKVLKGRSLTHSVCFGPPKPIRKPMRTAIPQKHECYTPTRVGEKDYDVRYIFEYRSKEMLKSLLVIPRTPSPEPFEEANFSQLSREEMLTRMREYQAVINSNVRIKRERADEDHETRKKARREANLSRKAGEGAIQLELNEEGGIEETVRGEHLAQSSTVIDLCDDLEDR